MPLAFHFAARSDVGMVRSGNEDSGYAGPHLLAMADGMGGHAGGEVASSTVIGALVDLDLEAMGAAEVGEKLLEAITDANSELGRLARAEPQLKGMGTTLIALLRARDMLVLAHIGDSRAYLARDGEVTQVTKDHSFVQTLVDEGRITSDEAAVHPQRSLVTRVLTGHDDDEPDLMVRQIRVGDRYLICSDGLSDYVARDTIDDVLTGTGRPEDAAERLVGLALRAGAPDNVTVVIGDVVDMTQQAPPPTEPQIVGAAAAFRDGTRPLPLTPAAKAAALTRMATGVGPAETDTVTLSEGSATGRLARTGRWLAVLAIAAVVLLGGGYAVSTWLSNQWYVGDHEGQVALYQGLNGSLGPRTLYQVQTLTDIPVADLPDNYRLSLAEGVPVADRDAAADLLMNLEVQAKACAWARSQGEACQTVPRTWTTPSPTPTPTATPSASPTASASESASATASPTTTAAP